ncbi:mitochondrial carrier domain-containing protein [Dipodascopsis tothii]|uniref:mitochondrial carrier domain-containing protein n=1 Tax=Dipodascopsis tothii TaxID=44089 RepID=UPI0034CF0CF7
MDSEGRKSKGRHIRAGFVSGLSSAVILQPLDLLKTRIQQASGSNLRSAVEEIARDSRQSPLAMTRQLWRGTLPSAMRTSVGSALYFTSLHTIRSSLGAGAAGRGERRSSVLPRLQGGANLAAGAVARGAVGFLTMPLTVVKVRYESSLYQYRSVRDAATSLWRAHGVRGFWYGFGATFVRDAPSAGLYVFFYEHAKAVVPGLLPTAALDGPANGPADGLLSSSTSAAVNSACAGLSAGLATAITNPFDTIKTRIQLQPDQYRGLLSAGVRVVREEGVRGLFDGLGMRISRKAMSACIAWCIYEELVR